MTNKTDLSIVLTAVNAKYIHSCPAVWSLKGYTQQQSGVHVDVREYTINDRYETILADLARTHADIYAFAVYIWNVDRICQLLSDLRKLYPEVLLIAGGPEATNRESFFLGTQANAAPKTDLVILGEGEETFAELVTKLQTLHRTHTVSRESFREFRAASLNDIRGICWNENGETHYTCIRPPMDMDRLPFLYQDLTLFENRILYYEASRGCPFSCSYCLSGSDRHVRCRSLAVVQQELQFFLDHRVKQVKFVDRTFNADKAFALAIWEYIRDHDNGITNFHFELEGNLITEAEVTLLTSLRPGLVQLEIGIQSTNPQTLRAIHRSPRLDLLEASLHKLTTAGNINIHLDLIAGLPYEDLTLFQQSFNRVYAMRPNQFQLGFLKVLSGTELAQTAEQYGIVASDASPYEVLKTRWLSFDELCTLHEISDMIETFANSQFFCRSLPRIQQLFDSAYDMFSELSAWYIRRGYDKNRPSSQKLYALLIEFLQEHADGAQLIELTEYIHLDKALHFNPSRHMSAREIFQFEGRPVTLAIDYSLRSPVNGEASFVVLEGQIPLNP